MAIKFLSAIDHGAYQLPTADGSNGQVLTTDGDGNVTFQTVPASSNFYLNGASFNTGSGVLTLSVSGASNQTVDLDGRYALTNHVHDYDNYSSWNLKTNGTQRTTVQSGGVLDLVAGSNVALSYSAGGKVTISSTDTNTNTTYSAGNGIGLSGTTFSVAAGAGLTQDASGLSLTSGIVSAGTYGSTSNQTKVDTITVDTYGRVTAVTTGATGDITGVTAGTGLSGGGSSGAVTVNLSHLGLESLADPNADRVAFWDDSAGAFQWLTMGSNLSISGTTLNATDTNTNTTYSAGSGLSLSGTTFSHTDTSSQSSVNNSGNTVIQDVTLDTYGHITGLSSTTLSLSGLGYTGATNANYITNNNQLTNGAGYQTLTQVNEAIQTVVDSAPAALDTLNELAAALGDDSDFAGTMTTALAGKLSTTGKAADSNLLDGLDLSTGRNNVANQVMRTNASGYAEFGWINTTSGNTTGTITDVYINTNDGYIRKATPAHFRSQITNGHYDSAGSAAAVDARITEEVLPAIPTNNNQLTNGAGYVTSSGNTVIGTDTDINTSGNVIIDNIYVTDGVITSMGTRVLDLSDLGFTGAANANYITNNNQLTNGAGYITSYVNTQRTDAEIADVVNQQLIDGSNISIEPYEGRLIISATNTQLTDAQVRSKFSAGTNIAISAGGVISSTVSPRTDEEISFVIDQQLVAGSNINIDDYEGRLMLSASDTNTTYSPGGGLDLSGTTFSIESDLRGEAWLIGPSTADYINVTNTYIDFVLDNAVDMRLYNTGTLHVEGDVIAYSTTISDKRFKDDIVTIDSALDKIKKLRGVEYTWNTGSRKGKRDLGLIAQEVEEVLPEIVHEHEMPLMQDAEEGEVYKTVDYEKMVGVLIEAMKDQQKQIEELKSRLDGLTK